MQLIIDLLKVRTGHDFSAYKPKMIEHGIEKQMLSHQLNNHLEYLSFLQASPEKLDALLKDLLIRVTWFFRDSSYFDWLKDHALPVYLRNKADHSPLRIWIPGCSTGEEAYSMAIILEEYLASSLQSFNIEIIATDIDRQALMIAERGEYSAYQCKNISQERLNQFFIKNKHGFRIKNNLKNKITFNYHNVIQDPPYHHLDIISCKNLLIYFNTVLQKKIIQLFHDSLKREGILQLGSAEFIYNEHLFKKINKKFKIFTKMI